MLSLAATKIGLLRINMFPLQVSWKASLSLFLDPPEGGITNVVLKLA